MTTGAGKTSSRRLLLDRRLWSRIWELARPQHRLLAGIAAVGLVATVVSLLIPIAFMLLVGELLAGDRTRLLLTALGIVVAAVFHFALRTWQVIASARATAEIGTALQTTIFDRLQRQEHGFFKVSNAGAVTTRTVDETVAAALVYTHAVAFAVHNVAGVALTSAALIALDWRAAVPLALLAVGAFYARRYEGRYRQAAFDEFVTRVELGAHTAERLNVDGNLLVKLHGEYVTEANRFRERAHRMWAVFGRVATLQGVVGNTIGLAISLIAVLILLGAVVAGGTHLTAGPIVAIILYLRLIEPPLAGMAEARLLIARDLVAFTRVLEVLDALPANGPEAPRIELVARSAPTADVPMRRGRLEFDQVTYRYPRRSEMAVVPTLSLAHEMSRENPPTLRDVSFAIEPGTMVAVVGRSGAGKSTIAMLAAGILFPRSGTVTLDGASVRPYVGDGGRSPIAYVTQSTYLLHDTLRANVLYARPDASEHELHDACVASGVHRFAWGLPLRYRTIIGENGARLSGGERQRIALARAILRRPDLVILDEATAHLDPKTEAFVRDALTELFGDRSRLVIAHRLETVRHADVILVMEDGAIVERGDHDALLGARGTYADQYDMLA